MTTEQVKHTPGPWTAYTDDKRKVWLILSDSEPERKDGAPAIATDNEADAKLIAAAPDMLAALKVMVETRGGMGISPEVKAAVAAIAKAEGHTP